MFTIGHIATTYLLMRVLNFKGNHTPVYISANIPDLDILIPFVIQRGPTHSYLAFAVFCACTLLIHKKYWSPVGALAYALHLLTDMIFSSPTKGIMLHYPNTEWVNFGLNIPFLSPIHLILEGVIVAFAWWVWRRENE